MRRGTTTLYLRGMPVPLIREVKAAAARRGTTLAAFVAQALERETQTPGGHVAALDDPLTADMEWYARHRRRLVSQYAGQYVAVVDGKVVDHDRDFGSLATRVFERMGVRPVFMPLVRETERPVQVRSPRRASA